MGDTINAGRAVEIELDDGTKETVLARAIPARDVRAYLTSLEDTKVQVSLTVRKPVEWVDRLSLPSFLELSALADEINARPLALAYHRNIERVELFAPGTKARMEAGMSSILAGGAPPLPSSAGSPSTPSSITASTSSTPSGSPSSAGGSSPS